jgi:CheY-like chemotaxis protein
MRSAQAERLRSLGTMAGGLAHDFNNLLFIISGYLQMLRDDDAVAEQERLLRYVDRASDAAERGAEIASSLLSVARSQPLEATAVEVGSFLTRLFPLVDQAVGADRGAELVLGDGPLDVLVDSGQLSGSVLNLVINARDAMELGGTVTIGVERRTVDDPELDLRPGDYVVVTVVDDGCGMSADTLERAFEPYFSTKGAGHGTGIGLAAVYSFAQQSGGIATITSVRDLGTSVTLYLPAVFARHDESPVPAVDRPPTRRVLVVDDESSLAGLIAGWLTEQGAEVRVAETPTQALRIAQDFTPDVLLTDVRLGDPDGVDGPTLAGQVESLVPGVAVVFMTGFSDRMHDLQAMGMHTLAKPFTKEALGRVVFPLASASARDDGGPR